LNGWGVRDNRCAVTTSVGKLAEGKGRMKITPMLEQYLRAKSQHPDSLLLFRLGDFYELFFEDAETAAGVLDITLTTRSKKDEVPIPMCGVPHHSVQAYVAKLLGAGFKVALCDQVEEPTAGKKLVAREIVRVMTPGTVTEEEYLDPKQPNYLLALRRDDSGGCAVVWTDLSTGDLRYAATADTAATRDLLQRLAPREVVLAADGEDLRDLVAAAIPGAMISPVAAARFDAGAGARWAQRAEGGADWGESVLQALGCVVWYLEQTHRASLDHLRSPSALDTDRALMVDEATRRNLELLTTTRGERRGSLLSVIDRTATPMGGRLLREWLLAPLTDIAAIGRRLDAVEALLRQPARRDELRRRLGGIGDLERLNARLGARRVHARDLLGLGAALDIVAEVRSSFVAADPEALRAGAAELDDLPAMRQRIEQTIEPEVSLKPRPGGLIRSGCDERVDELRGLAHSGKRTLSELETREREVTGISSLKVRYNNVFGYYLEVTKANLRHVPAHYRRKQTTASGERFVTDELETYEAKVLGAEDKLAALETELFDELVTALAACNEALGRTARKLAEIDVFAALAQVADERSYVRPRVHNGRQMRIEEGRHPVVEAMSGRAGFVANDCSLDPDERQVLILTGPNMAGKSTYLRQVALITLLAQMGSFVPAAAAEIGIVDRLFTRIGAADNLAGGESTFMVEMKETANIVRDLTGRSLAILDEIGRGTSTFDGISIAWAVVEYLHDAPSRPLVLFATHYHELTDLSRSRERAVNMSVAVREWKGDVLFLRRVVDGPASQSYGIQVADLAGVPASIIARAKTILANLEKNELTASGEPSLAGSGGAAGESQLALFDSGEDPLRRELAAVDVESMTPVEALTRLDDLCRRAREGDRR
jgi:DNA mismatch repair protein MutS